MYSLVRWNEKYGRNLDFYLLITYINDSKYVKQISSDEKN